MRIKRLSISDIYQITIATTLKGTFTGLIKHSQPEIVNGFVAMTTDKGEWHYIQLGARSEILFTPMIISA